jgi:hypothetical protein
MYRMAMHTDSELREPRSRFARKSEDLEGAVRQERQEIFASVYQRSTAAVSCRDLSSRECAICPDYDECPFADRCSSLVSIGLPAVLAAGLAAAGVLWLIWR